MMRDIGFQLFNKFHNVHIGIFGKESQHTSDEECAQELGFDTCSKLHQIHGNTIHIVCEKSLNFETQGDGLITTQKNHALSVRFADCQGFVIYAPEHKVIGVLHAGWRGMAAHAITAFYEELKNEFDVQPSNTFVGAVPSLCKNCAEFSNPLNELPEHLHPFIQERFVDLQAAADCELDALRIPKKQRERHPTCTKCGDGFWSWRGDRMKEKGNFLVVGLL